MSHFHPRSLAVVAQLLAARLLSRLFTSRIFILISNIHLAPTPNVTSPSAAGKQPRDLFVVFVVVADDNRAYTEDDAPGNTKNPAGPNGDHKCDTPESLEESMYKAIHEAVPDAAFSVFTGDIVDHMIWNTSIPRNQHESRFIIIKIYLASILSNTGNSQQSLRGDEQISWNRLRYGW